MLILAMIAAGGCCSPASAAMAASADYYLTFNAVGGERRRPIYLQGA